jgi:hypothetical protein
VSANRSWPVACFAVILITAAAPSVAADTSARERGADLAPRLSDGHPDLSGTWLPSNAPRQQTKPSYKPEIAEKVKELASRQGYTDPTWKCAQPGVPRVGPPFKIVQRPGEAVFIYTDFGVTWVGMLARVIPTNGGPIPDGFDPSFYGNSVAHWDGDTLVVDSQNFVTSTWMASGGYIHSDTMRVQERLKRVGRQLQYDVTVRDPEFLTQPWVKAPLLLDPTDTPLVETPPCVPRTNDPDAILEQKWIESGRPE